MLNEVHRIPVAAWGFSEPAPNVDGDGPTFKRILLAATDSDACARAVVVVAGLAPISGSEVCVVHLIERLFLGRAGWCSMETADEAKRLLGWFRAELEARGLRVVARTGRARREERAIDILLAAAQFRADVIVIGTRR
jgi:nucleotide-binding universal stress UspA family protein